MTASTTRRATAARTRMAAVGAIAVAGALLLTACGDQTEEADKSKTESGSDSLHSKLPTGIQKSGVLKIGTDAQYAPMEYEEGGKIVGIDPDIAAALAKELGVKVQFTNSTFDGLVTTLNSGRQNAVMSAMSDTKARQEGLDDKGKKAGKGVDFVDYFTSGVSLLVKKGNPEGIKGLDDLCGKKVAVQRGTIYETTFKDQAKKCDKAGDKKLAIEAFDTDAEAQTRVKAGGAVADLNDYPVSAYIAKKAGGGKDFEVAGGQTDAGPFGIAVSKDEPQLREALKLALDKIIKSGEYTKVLEKWQVTKSAVDKASINAGS
ncbi:ABC transporter substrate-binding protein [Streptomyces sp. H27-D2]|uniref:ABC transporter substrate-binding protein n=1 Tax=Streptomyces sp. H27-D2 TaxID=3046304 RepID=UPI002DBF8A49|nr:ABC transporter substrate-binding protein [Streptomyces sp. H27-D2]MEC4018682.1 ABC transporter substrate-binding protein [Streptomyces sp. H27-D2]